MSKYRRFTRKSKHNKREGHKKKILFFGSLAALFLIIFSTLILFGNKGNPKQEVTEQEESETVETETENNHPEETEKNEEQEKESKPKDKNLEPLEKEEEATVKEVSTNDNNVIKAYEGDWDPIETEQEGPHTTTYDTGSKDRIEIKEALVMVTGLEEDNLIEHWIGRGGEGKVIATVSDNDHEEIYKVYLQWIDGEGWQPTKYEELKHYP